MESVDLSEISNEKVFDPAFENYLICKNPIVVIWIWEGIKWKILPMAEIDVHSWNHDNRTNDVCAGPRTRDRDGCNWSNDTLQNLQRKEIYYNTILISVCFIEERFNLSAEYCSHIENHTDENIYRDVEKEVMNYVVKT